MGLKRGDKDLGPRRTGQVDYSSLSPDPHPQAVTGHLVYIPAQGLVVGGCLLLPPTHHHLSIHRAIHIFILEGGCLGSTEYWQGDSQHPKVSETM